MSPQHRNPFRNRCRVSKPIGIGTCSTASSDLGPTSCTGSPTFTGRSLVPAIGLTDSSRSCTSAGFQVGLLFRSVESSEFFSHCGQRTVGLANGLSCLLTVELRPQESHLKRFTSTG